VDAAPHITLKLGFDTPTTGAVIDCVSRLARDLPPFPISIRDVGFFDDGVAFLDVEPNQTLERLRQAILTELVERHGIRREPIEDERFHFHVTLAYGLSPQELDSTRASFADRQFRRVFDAESIDVFRAAGSRWLTCERILFGIRTEAALPDTTDDSLEHLIHRRQFILSSEPGYGLPGGRELVVAGRYFLSVHRDLDLTHVERDGRSLTLLGFALDPDRPHADNHDILSELLVAVAGGADLFDSVESWGGRWVLIAHGTETIVLHDATAQRQCYFTRDASRGTITCGSEPGLMAERLGLSLDPEAVAFVQSRPTDDYEVYWMPGDSTLYAGLAALLPNHTLSLTSGTVRRFWPSRSLPLAGYPELLDESVRLLQGQMQSALHRAQLAIPLTAGWDSRLMLALCRDLKSEVYAFTIAYPSVAVGANDVTVPARLLAKLGIDHHVIPYPETVDEAFKHIFHRNNVSANTAYCADSQALYHVFPSDRVCVTGDAAEIVKSYFQRTRPESEPISGSELASLTRLGNHPFVERAFARWLDDAAHPPIDVLDLFCWEQVGGRWQSKVRAEYDIVQESFAPLSNRRLLRLMLCVDVNQRRAPDFEFFADLLKTLWPEVLSEPINPPEPLSRSRRIATALKLTGVSELVPQGIKARIKAVLR
jgi:2'-5' RNA ligase